MNLGAEDLEFNAKTIFIGIGGISRAGKSTLINKLMKDLKINEIVAFDDFLIGPIQTWDENINNYIEDWENPICWDIDRYFKTLIQIKAETKEKNRIVLVEGFLIFSRKDISDVLDYKIHMEIDKEEARTRRKNTKHYVSDHYFDEYIWKGFQSRKYIKFNHSVYFNKDDPNSFIINANESPEEVYRNAADIIQKIITKEHIN